MTPGEPLSAAGLCFVLTMSAVQGVKTMDPLLEKAVVSVGPEYLEAEEALRKRPPAATAMMRDQADVDPVARVIVDVVSSWQGPRAADYQQVLDFLEDLPYRLARTPVPTPSPTGVAGSLSDSFGPHVADLLALRLLKMPDWPRWQQMAVLFFLQEQKLPSLTAVLIRMVVETKDAEQASLAMRVISATDDPQLNVKIAAERERLEKLKRALPAALSALERKL